MKEAWKVALSDGTQLDQLRLNGNNFISTAKVTDATFAGKLSEVTITDPNGVQMVHEHMALVQISQCDGAYWFILRDLAPEERTAAKMAADIEYIAMMANVNLEEG